MNPHKENTINVVQLIADVDRQKEYERSVPITDVLAELVCQWFDDYYHPESRLYRETFTDRELEVLSEFNEFYDQRADQLPDTLEEMHSDLRWQEIVRKAQWVLHMLGWEDIEVRYVNS